MLEEDRSARGTGRTAVTAASPLMAFRGERPSRARQLYTKYLIAQDWKKTSVDYIRRAAAPPADDKRSHGCKRANGRTCTLRQEGWNTSWNTGSPGSARLTTATK